MMVRYPSEEPSIKNRRLAAWELHYINKGCSPRKAAMCASKKAHKINSWPPEYNDVSRLLESTRRLRKN